MEMSGARGRDKGMDRGTRGHCLRHLISSLLVISPAFASAQSTHQWIHIEQVPGGTACAARLNGNEVDTMLMLNEAGQLILVAGRVDWHNSGPEEVGLRIDQFELAHLQASAFENLVLLPISDAAVLGRLKVAKDLYWSLSLGRYHATVDGLGRALAWVRQCEQLKRIPTGGKTTIPTRPTSAAPR
jgi:hypothetical protein